MQNNNDNSQSIITLVRSEMTSENSFPEMRRRGQMMALMALVVLMLLSAVLLWNSTHLASRFESRLSQGTGGNAKIRLYSEQLASLQERMAGFIADSVETRLRTLEGHVAAGTVGAAEIQAFEDLRNELKLLESYSKGRDQMLPDPSRSDHPRFQMTPGSAAAVTDTELLGDVLELKTLAYFSIASCGLVALMIGGYWWQYHSRLKRITANPGTRLLLARGPATPHDS